MYLSVLITAVGDSCKLQTSKLENELGFSGIMSFVDSVSAENQKLCTSFKETVHNN